LFEQSFFGEIFSLSDLRLQLDVVVLVEAHRVDDHGALEAVLVRLRAGVLLPDLVAVRRGAGRLLPELGGGLCQLPEREALLLSVAEPLLGQEPLLPVEDLVLLDLLDPDGSRELVRIVLLRPAKNPFRQSVLGSNIW
jgi:hypothetical protein